MAQTIDVPGHGLVEFPDGMSDKDIVTAIKKIGAAPTAQAKPSIAQQVRGSSVGGLIQGGRDLIDGGAQLLYNALPEGAQKGLDTANNWLADKTGLVGTVPQGGLNAKIAQDEADYQRARESAGRDGFDASRLIGNVAASAAIPGSTLANVPASLTARTALGAVQGGALSALQPVTKGDYWSEKGDQVATGAITGGVMAPVAGALARVVKPNTSEQVKTLLREGITPTPGQIMGGRWQTLEDKLTSVPGLGDVIQSARGRGLDEFNKAAYKRALTGIADTPQEVGRGGVQAVKDALGTSYDDILSRTGFKADDSFNSSMATLSELTKNLPSREARQFKQIIEREVSGQMAPNGGMTGEVVKRVESQLGKEAKTFNSSSDAYQNKLGDALREAQQILRDTISRQNPQVAEELANTNAGYANYARIRDAASRSGSESGKFTPAQLAAAVRSADKSVGKGATATGTAFMQDLSDAGKAVLASKYPDSGTAGRAAAGLGLFGGAAAIDPTTAMIMAGSALPYLPVLNKATAAALAKRPEQAEKLAELIRKSAPLIGFGASSALQQ